MKVFIALLVALCMSLSSIAQTRVTAATRNQPNYVPAAYCTAGQMYNIANAYAGNLLDTPATGTATLYLYTSINGSISNPVVPPVSAADTFVPYPVYGDGTISIVVLGLKISGTPAGTLTLEESPDGVHWGPSKADIVADAVDTVVNTASVQRFTFKRSVKTCPYYRAVIALTGTEQSSWSSWYFFNRKQWLSVN